MFCDVLPVFKFRTAEYQCGSAAATEAPARHQYPENQLLGVQRPLPDQPRGQSLPPTAGARTE